MNLRRAWENLQAAARKGPATEAGRRPPSPHLTLGIRGEEAAAQFLRSQGYKILARNFRGRTGELDIVAREGDTLVFVEVKTRRSEEIIAPHEAVNLEKQKHLTKVGIEYVRKLADQQVRVRFDIVEVIMTEADRVPRKINLIQNAFEPPAPYLF